MAIATTNVTPDPVSALAGNLGGGTPAADVAVEDLGVAPFDYSQLDLDEERESPTNNLRAGGTPEGPATSMLETAGESGAESADGAADGKVWSEADGDTSLFMPLLTEDQTEEAEGAEMPTTFIQEQASTETSGETATEDASGQATTEPEQPVFRARVARDAWGTPAAAPSEPHVTQPEPAETETRVRKANVTAVLSASDLDGSPEAVEPPVAPTMSAAEPQDGRTQPATGEDYAPKMPARGDIQTSGPLPSLAGFEDLNTWIERYPNDLGAHLALASTYTQAGDIDTALRVYRRMLRKPYVSDNILLMIQDELEDLEDQAHQYPRYYQVRGDLLVRQGHRREAIDEYNKLS